MEGWVKTGGRLGGPAAGGGGSPAPGPDGGARLTAAPGSGTALGGTGGGRSVNIWAKAGVEKAESSTTASAGHSRLPRRTRPIPSPPWVMNPAFHRKRGKFKP